MQPAEFSGFDQKQWQSLAHSGYGLYREHKGSVCLLVWDVPRKYDAGKSARNTNLWLYVSDGSRLILNRDLLSFMKLALILSAPQASQSEDETETESMRIFGAASCHGLTAVPGSGQAGVDAGAG